MFQFTGLAPFRVSLIFKQWVSPFGNLRIKGYLHLPVAYRSLTRPSSPLRAKASAMCPYLLSNESNISNVLLNYDRDH